MTTKAAVLAVLLAGASVAHADENEGLTYDAVAFSGAAIGRPDTSLRGGAYVEVNGPIAVGEERGWGRILARLSLESLPEKGFAFQDLANWNQVASVSLTGAKRVGVLNVGSQRITTSFIVQGRFSTAFFDAAEDPQRRRFYRAVGGGVRLAEETEGLYLEAIYCRDEAVGVFGFGHLNLAGSVPIKGSPARILAFAGLGFGEASFSGRQGDYFLLNMAVSIGDILDR